LLEKLFSYFAETGGERVAYRRGGCKGWCSVECNGGCSKGCWGSCTDASKGRPVLDGPRN
ncbi:MAG: hypothetical protein LBB04_03820, partial [Oscillospiraceae bacterium]|nr:hypothetical protein [Oscillospiraceae bacterium]